MRGQGCDHHSTRCGLYPVGHPRVLNRQVWKQMDERATGLEAVTAERRLSGHPAEVIRAWTCAMVVNVERKEQD